jgi:hypothetical protein
MVRLNLAYVPADQEFAVRCIDFAQRHFGGLAAGYLLHHKQALPHVTVCQFDAAAMPAASLLTEAQTVCRWRSSDLSFDTIYFRSGINEHMGYVWTGLGVCRNRALIAAQQRVVAWLKTNDFTVWTAAGELYFPHLTFARLARPAPAAGAAAWTIGWPGADLHPRSHRFDPALGLADPNGALTQILYRSGV